MGGIVLIGASTGAPRTHHVYLQAMPAGFSAPIIIIQHMPAGPFIEGLLRYLSETVKTPVKFARDGDPLLPGTVLVVEPGRQLRFSPSGKSVCVRPADGENFFAPSMNVTFASAAGVFGRHCFAAMLSGLHADIDGLQGCKAIRRAGGKVLVTDRATTACYIMIQQVFAAGECDAEAPLQRILPEINRWMRE
jgi:two-component system chemotaxis response regulator CheB